MLGGKIQYLAVPPKELNLGLLASTTTSELQPPGITILYVYCNRVTEQLHTRQAGLVVTWLKVNYLLYSEENTETNTPDARLVGVF